MRSLIIIEVEHGETTDALNEILHKVENDLVHQVVHNYQILGTTVKVDIPACFVL